MCTFAAADAEHKCTWQGRCLHLKGICTYNSRTVTATANDNAQPPAVFNAARGERQSLATRGVPTAANIFRFVLTKVRIKMDMHVHRKAYKRSIPVCREVSYACLNDDCSCVFIHWSICQLIITRCRHDRFSFAHLSTRLCIVYTGLVCPRRLTFTCWECYDLCQRHKPTKPAHSSLFCSCVYFCLLGLFNCIYTTNSPDDPQFSHSVLPVLALPYWSFELYICF